MTSIDNIPQWKMNKLVHCSIIYDCKLLLPPFEGNINEAAFDIENIKDTSALKVLITIIQCMGFEHEYAKKNERIYMVVCLGDK